MPVATCPVDLGRGRSPRFRTPIRVTGCLDGPPPAHDISRIMYAQMIFEEDIMRRRSRLRAIDRLTDCGVTAQGRMKSEFER